MAGLIKIRKFAKEIIELSSKSAILADPKSKLFCLEYSKLNKTSELNERSEFLKTLSQDHGFQNERLYDSLNSIVNLNKSSLEFKRNFKQTNYDKLSLNLKPEYYRLFQNLGRVKDGVYTLVKLRHDLLDTMEQNKKNKIVLENEEDLKMMKSVLKNLLVLWFTTGLLDIQRIDWNSPASLVEKVAHYESVHKIRTLNDLKARLSPSRRCFIYTHSSMPFEPLVILHIALTNSISSSIEGLVRNYNKSSNESNTNQTELEAEKCTNAIFYSINSCQKGLQQVELGNSLIKSCVRLLLHELPNLRDFHTLSPIPNFKEWLDLKLSFARTHQTDQLLVKGFFKENELEYLRENFGSVKFPEMVDKFKNFINTENFRTIVRMGDYADKTNEYMANFLKRSCAYYLYSVKKSGFAFNSVCNFHIKNGAQIYRINLGADLSDHGWASSYSLMTNYGYYLNELDDNCVDYLTNKNIKISDHIRQLLLNFK